jgi:hypothetical protein
MDPLKARQVSNLAQDFVCCGVRVTVLQKSLQRIHQQTPILNLLGARGIWKHARPQLMPIHPLKSLIMAFDRRATL